ncbi:DEAD-box ATP-dependent RNA helicase FANCM [Rosa sericea]
MTSTDPHHIVDDDEDDDFDWEAAARAVDVVTQTTANPSSSHFAPPPPIQKPAFPPIFHNKPGTSRQTTLDRFIGKPAPNPQPEIRDCGDERVSRVQIDAEKANTWLYPVNFPGRDYQFAITKTALFSNTLVALPTGLGKTLIAAVVMYNYFRWFPDGKIVFAAPSRPLVTQQIEACHNIVGIPQEWTIDMTGQISPTKRACFWKTKRVFFVTPQVLEKDIQSGTCSVKYLVCLVIDEAHRALGNYASSVAVRELMAAQVPLRILALTATPGSKQQTVQQIIDNLCISSLEYREENDADVSPYVHNREVELIKVAMGQDAVEISNKIYDAIRPYLTRLSATGVLPNRDAQTWSPGELLRFREKFRLAPPPDFPQSKYGEIEGWYGVLLTGYHILKLLSSHGIRPAYDMLEEKLKQGFFAKYMSRSEDVHKAKLRMQQSLSHGPPSPKLSKLLEVLLDHFKTKDPQNSRVMIFSNFRGSVREIMDALANIGNLVRATEFIGQSSGKILKGQSQKVQQAVLEKFRAGGYNVIVATSIGEEGLDIMEVDLVICFDANVSPLRMIQRMGRTGRKHDGRVVVLACEGSELKGYKRKLTNSKNVSKHMRNGGINSFNFHSSPRMIPHIFKPEVQYVEFSIEQFVRPGKKVKDDNDIQTPVTIDKLTAAETSLVAKYFQSHDVTWKSSLIAFPHFQTYPSRVYKVMHSPRTTMLIDTMQSLQGLSFSSDRKISLIEDEVCSEDCLAVDTVEQRDNREDLLNLDGSKKQSQEIVLDFELQTTETLETKEKHSDHDLSDENPSGHSFLFGSGVVDVDASGKVLIISVPILHGKSIPNSKFTSASSSKLDRLKQSSCHVRTSDEEQTEVTTRAGANGDPEMAQIAYIRNHTPPWSRLCESESWMETTINGDEENPQKPILKGNFPNGDSAYETPDVLKSKAPTLLADEDDNLFRDGELSPRLTNLIKSGVVPESPINNSGILDTLNNYVVPDAVSPAPLPKALISKSSCPGKNGKATDMDTSACERNVSLFPTDNEIQSPLHNRSTASINESTSTSPVIDRGQTVLADLTNSSCSKDWCIGSGDKSQSVKQTRKFKRLRKVGDHWKSRNQESMTTNDVPRANLTRSFISTTLPTKHRRGTKIRAKKSFNDVREFIDEEAEVSSEDISDDEEDEPDNYSNDSFIDDRINSTAASTQAATSGIDMMAVYRRSLLTQSPMERQPSSSATFSPNSVATITRTPETGSSGGKTSLSLQTPQSDSTNLPILIDSKSLHKNWNSEARPCTTGVSPGYERDIESRKRKSSFHHSRSIPAVNLELEFSLQSEAAGRNMQHSDAHGDMLYDDQFYEGLDLDALEAQATILLKQKSELPVQKPQMCQLNPENPILDSAPSFDLGI